MTHSYAAVRSLGTQRWVRLALLGLGASAVLVGCRSRLGLSDTAAADAGPAKPEAPSVVGQTETAAAPSAPDPAPRAQGTAVPSPRAKAVTTPGAAGTPVATAPTAGTPVPSAALPSVQLHSLGCAAGGCGQSCAAGKKCSFNCAGGGCQQSCAAGATCTMSCDGGGCRQSCAAGSTCSKSCLGASCS